MSWPKTGGKRLLPGVIGWDPATNLKLRRVPNPHPGCTLGDCQIAVRVSGPERFPETILVIPYDAAAMRGIDVSTVRMFRWNRRARRLRPVWRSRVNPSPGFEYIWASIRRPGVYLPLGLPRDRLLQEAMCQMACERRFEDTGLSEVRAEITRRYLRPFLEAPAGELESLRRFLTRVELQNASVTLAEVPRDQGGHPTAFPWPQGATLESFRERLREVDVPPSGLPEEELFFPPEISRHGGQPWPQPYDPYPWKGLDPADLPEVERLGILDSLDLRSWINWLYSKNWWMYQHDVHHTGLASGPSDIRSTNVGTIVRHAHIPLDGPVLTKPSIVDGKIFVGTSKHGAGGGGTLHKIDLATGVVEGRFPTKGVALYDINGIGGSPAIADGKVFFTTVYGQVYCLDAATMTACLPHPPALWKTDLKKPCRRQNQPVRNHNGDCWSGPLVVNGRVYVGSGEGENDYPYGFIFCLNADTGKVEWLYCTNKFEDPMSEGCENNPNMIPENIAAEWAEDAGFILRPGPQIADPKNPNKLVDIKGSAVWSSCAYDSALDRIYVGTGNSLEADYELPDARYGSGMISLCAKTGEYKGFFQPRRSDNYNPADEDVDISAGPTTFTRSDGESFVCFGSKGGSFFLLDPRTLEVKLHRQILPRAGGTGLPNDVGEAICSVAPPGGENEWGVYATAAVHPSSGKIFVGLGGRSSIGDQHKTPFVRALDWDTLKDAWPTATDPKDDVLKYTSASPPLYTSEESGLSSPAVVNDVVFVSTGKIALYAFDAATGLCLWGAPDLPSTGPGFLPYCLGPAIYGNYVVVGAGTSVYVYKLPGPPVVSGSAGA